MAFQLVHPLRAFRPFLTLSMGILRWRIGAAFCRGAVAEAGTWGLLRERFLRRLPVLLYHHVGAAKSGAYPGLTVSPEKFRAHIEWLARWGYIGIRPSDWLMWRNKGVPLPEKSVLITFDDAYADTCDNAFPILSRFGFGAACMVVTDLIGSTNRWDERRGLPMFRLMSEQQIRCWADKGIEFGAHSRSHRSLAGLPADAVANEVDGSKEHLTRVTGKPVLSFAYPFGLYDDLARARVAGTFELAFTTEPVVNTLSTDPHLMGRTEPLEGDNPIGFRARLRWGFNPAARLRAKLCRW
jgi:peptidoglycan/xylan/chitin deacetylase (PgdA/CDA1 family)